MSYATISVNDNIGFSASLKTRRYTVPYEVTSTTENDQNIAAALAAAGLPTYGSVYPYDSGAFMSSISLSEINRSASGLTIFKFNAEYVTPDAGEISSTSTSVFDQRPRVTFGSIRYSRVMEKAYKSTDAKGSPSEPVQTSAGDPFDPPPMTTVINTLIKIDYVTADLSPGLINNLLNTCNSKPCSIVGISVPIGFGRINELGAQNNFDSTGNEYWSVSVSVELSSEGPFKKIVMDRGFQALDTDGKKYPIYTLSGQPKIQKDVSQTDINSGKAVLAIDAVKLDGTGKIYTGEKATAVYKEFQENYRANWTSLNIPERRETNNNRSY